MKADRVRVSVVIPTKDRPQAVVDAVRSVFNCTYTDFEVIVVDQDRNGESRAALAQLACDGRLRCISNVDGRPGAASSRNLGIALSSGSIIAVLDDDVTVARDWMRNIVSEFDGDPELMFVAGRLGAPPHDGTTHFVPSFDPDAQRLTSWTMPIAVAGANFSMRRELFEGLGGYEDLWGPGSPWGVSDDVDLALRVARSGFKWKACSGIAVEHTHGVRNAHDAAGLLRAYQIGNGVIYGRATRRGDLAVGLWFLWWNIREIARVVVRNLLRGRGPHGLGWVAQRLVGFCRGLAIPPHLGVVSSEDLGAMRRRIDAYDTVCREPET